MSQFNNRVVSDPGNGGAIPVGNYNTICNMTSTGASDTRTVANPKYLGQTCTLALDVDGGGLDITAASAVNQAGNTVMDFSHAGDFAKLCAVHQAGALRWQVIGSDGVAFS